MNTNPDFEHAVAQAAAMEPTAAIADRRLLKVCEPQHGYGLELASAPFYGRTQLSRDTLQHVREVCLRLGCSTSITKVVDIEDQGVAMALIARLLDRSEREPVKAVEAELDEVTRFQAKRSA